ncbi:unnamed protein product, partial [Rotaria magnacalcarata]
NTSTEIVDVTLPTTAINATSFTTSVPLEITDVNVIELNATLKNDINVLTTILTQINETQVNAENVEEEQTTMASNTPCDLSKSGCCLTGKNDTNNEGCNDEMVNYVSISNSTIALNNNTESISTIKNDDMVMTTEKIEVSSETINEHITSVIINENVSTESNMHNATEAAIVEDSQENIDSITTEKVESSTTT